MAAKTSRLFLTGGNHATTSVEAMERRFLMSAGALDPTFGTGGQVTLPGGFPNGGQIVSVTPGPNGNVFETNSYSGGYGIYGSVTELNANGTLNTHFGTDGTFNDVAPAGFHRTGLGIFQVIPESNGDVLVLGDEIQRLTPAGVIDPSYMVSDSGANGGVILANGKLLAFGGAGGGATLSRYNADGTPDTTFGTNGVLTVAPTGESVEIQDIKLDSEGRPILSVVVSAISTPAHMGSSTSFGIIRLTAAGILDTTYGVHGFNSFVSTPLTEIATAAINGTALTRLAIAPDGSVDELIQYNGNDFLFGFFSDGKIVTGGRVTIPGDGGDFNDLAVQSDGDIIAVGGVNDGTAVAIDRFQPITPTSTGIVFDSTFNGSGSVQLQYPQLTGPGPSDAESVAIDSRGRILVGSAAISVYDAVTRVLATGSGGSVSTNLTGTVIGTAGSYQNRGNTAANAFDGELTSFFDAPGPDNDWAGLDLGSPQTIAKISFAPRDGFASRMVGGVFQGSDSPDFSTGVQTLYQVTAAPPVEAVTVVGVGDAGPFRYVRYLGPAGSYGNVASIIFWRPLAAPAGVAIGTSGSYKNQGNSLSNAFDGNMNTFFDAPTPSGSWVGMDFGSPVAILQIKFAPRGGWVGFAQRMVGGEFQASDTPDFSKDVYTVYTITAAPPQGQLTSAFFAYYGVFQYWRYIGPTNGVCNIAELQFLG